MKMMDVKAGDKVVVESGGLGGTKYTLEIVDRLTKTQIVIGRHKFRRDSGVEVGGGWYKDRLYLPTEAMLQRVNEYQKKLKKYHLVKDLHEFDWNQFDLKRLNEIANFVGLNK